MFGWLRELYEIRQINRVCPSCEVLKVELSHERHEKEMLLKTILNPRAEPEPNSSEPAPAILKHKPWRVKQQELETADRLQHQQILKEFKNKVDSVKTAELEKSMGIKDA